MQLEFNCISELGEPGIKFKKLFHAYWPEYKTWLDSNRLTYLPDLDTSLVALKKYMPEMVPIYHKLCKLVDADPLAAQFLTGFQPPPYLSACSQAVLVKDEIQLVRNYDFHPSLLEGTLLESSWSGKKVIATSDCLIGVIDGMNENGLAISLTFGGRKVVGEGFGIPFILRYVLEFCDTVEEAVKALMRIPSHMAYNVTIVDRSGSFKTVQLSPDNAPVITNSAYATNHQGEIDWIENANFNKTVERAEFLSELLDDKNLDVAVLANAFMKAPLYNSQFSKGFGTLYTVDYRPLEGRMHLRWPEKDLVQSFNNFTEENILITFNSQPNESESRSNLSDSKDELKNIIPRKNISWEILTKYAKKLNKKRRKLNINVK